MIAIQTHKDNVENRRRNEEYQARRNRLLAIEKRDPKSVSTEDIKFVESSAPAIEFVNYCITAILAGNVNAVGVLKESESRSKRHSSRQNGTYWTWGTIGLSSKKFLAVCKRVMKVSPDGHWARMYGDALRRKGDALSAIEVYSHGIKCCGADVMNPKRKIWPWPGNDSSMRRVRPLTEWATISRNSYSDLDACYFGLAVCRRHIADEEDARDIKQIEFAGRYDLVKSGVEYERFVAGLIKNAGFTSEMTPTTDQGVDIIVTVRNIRIAVQCKFYAESVSNAAVQEVVAGKAMYNCSRACVVSNSTFTPSAKALARVNHVRLLHHGKVVAYLNGI